MRLTTRIGGGDEYIARCPFCGGEAIHRSEVQVEPILDENGAYIDADTYYFEMTGCPACNIFFDIEEDESEGTTIEKWNRRAE